RDAIAMLDHMRVEDRWIGAARRGGKAIAEGFVESLSAGTREIDVDAAPVMQRQHTQIVDAVAVVGVLMRVEDSIDPIDLGIEQLLAQIAAGVDQYTRRLRHALPPAFDQQRAAPATIAWLVGIAFAPVIADPGNTARGAAAQNGGDDPVRLGHGSAQA